MNTDRHRERGPGEADRLLVEAADVRPGERVLDLGCEGRAVGFGLAGTAEEVCFVSSDVRDIRLCQSEIETLGLSSMRPLLAGSLGEVSGGPFDAVLYGPAQRAAKERVFERIDEAFVRMRMGGRLCLAGRRDRGVVSYAKRLQAVFGNMEKVARTGRVYVYRAHKEAEAPGAAPVDTAYAFDAPDLPGGPYRFKARAGVFSRDGLDLGTRFLIETMRVRPEDRVLDLGCGYGALGIVAARLASKGEATLVDADLRAVRCARENLAENGIANARAEVSDAFEALSGEQFDLIVSNPPFHEGNATAHPFIEGAAAHLAPGGRLLLVVMRPEPYRKRMRRVFASVQDKGRQGGYVVLMGRRPKPPQGTPSPL